MKYIINSLTAAIFIVLVSLTACSNEEQMYDGPTYIMFADTMNICPVFQENTTYQVPLSVTKAATYDRTFGVEVLQTESNAIEGFHYTIESNTVVIPAGKLAASVDITPVYDHIEKKDSLNIRLRLVTLDEELEWNYYGLETNVSFRKIGPFDIQNFTGYAMVTSTFLYQYKPREYQRLITTEQVEGKPNTVVLHDFLSDGYDVKLTLDNSNPLKPKAALEDGTIIGPTEYFIGQMIGDNMLRVANYAAIESTFDAYDANASLFSLIYVKKEGYLGAYVNVIEWISDAEAENILKNGF